MAKRTDFRAVFAEILREHFGPGFPYEAVEARWSGLYHARLAQGPVPLKPGALDLLEFLAGLRLPVAEASQPGVNANLLTDEVPLDVPSGTHIANGIPVEVAPV